MVLTLKKLFFTALKDGQSKPEQNLEHTHKNKEIATFREEARSVLAGFHGWCSSILVELEFGVFVFVLHGSKTGEPGGKTLGARREPTTKLTHIWHRAGMEPGPYWREASALTTAPSLKPKFHIRDSLWKAEISITVCAIERPTSSLLGYWKSKTV